MLQDWGGVGGEREIEKENSNEGPSHEQELGRGSVAND